MRLTKFHTYSLDGLGTQTQYPVGTVSGLVPLYNGGFDALGGAINLQARSVSYQFDLTKDNAATIRDKINLFQAAMMHGRGLLHAINRDDVPLQTWGKVSSVDAVRGPGSGGYQTLNVDFEVFYPYWMNSNDEPETGLYFDDGLLLDTAGLTLSYGNSDTTTITGADTAFTVDNTGPVPVPRNLIIITPRAGASIGEFTLHNTTNHYQFSFTDALAAEETLYIDTASKTIHIDGTDAYDLFTVGEVQRLWMVLDPDDNDIEITTADVVGTTDVTWVWSRHYVL